MAQFTLTSLSFLTLMIMMMSSLVFSQPALNPLEQESLYKILESINSDYPWRSLFPDDLCLSAPHGIVCDYLSDTDTDTPHVTELSFGYVSDYSPNPPCSISNSTLDPSLYHPLTHLRKLFFYKCFTHQNNKIPFPDLKDIASSLEELVFIENPGLVGSIEGKIGSLRSLRRLVLTGTGVSGGITSGFGELVNLEQLTLSRNKFKGEIFIANMKRLKVLDLSENEFHGNVPDSIGNLSDLLKVDFSYNGFSGRIPMSFKNLKKLEFMDLSYNRFGNFGVPLFLADMPGLKEVYLSGNLLGGEIPHEIWGNLGGIKGIGLSGLGLVGNIPKSMGLHLRNVSYLGLDNNKLEGSVPAEFGALELVSELNLENNSLSGRVPFSADFVSKLGGKLKLEGNFDLCVDEGLVSVKASGGKLGQLKICRQPNIAKSALVYHNFCPRVQHASFAIMFLWVLSVFLVLS